MTHQTLLAIKLFELSGDEIGKIKRDEVESNRRYDTILPEFCLHSENGTLRKTVDYLQWIETGEEKYFLFEAHTLDDILFEEISNCGIEEMLKGIDLRPYFKEFQKLTYKNLLHRGLQSGQYLVISVSYTGGGYWNDDWDCDIYVSGVLSNNLKYIEPVVA